MPITGELDGQNTRGLLARVNFLRDEPGGRRFFVNDLNGPLYILDKQTKTVHDLSRFQRRSAGGPACSRSSPSSAISRPASSTSSSIPTTRATACSTRSTWRIRPSTAPAAPKAGVVAGLDLSGYTTTPAIATPTRRRADRSRSRADRVDGPQSRERDVRGHGARAAARCSSRAHPSAGRDDLQSGRPARRSRLARHVHRRPATPARASRSDIRRMNPQRLDTLVGKILRIVPDLREHTATSTVSENGRYRIPNDNPFVAVEGARKEIWAYGPAQSASADLGRRSRRSPRAPRLFAFNIGLTAWETVVIIQKGANYGYSLREGPQAMSLRGDGAGAGGRHDSGADLGHGRARHGQADLPGDCSTRTPADRRRRDRRRLRLPRHADPGAERQARVRRHHDRPHLVRRAGRRARGRRRQRRRPSRRFTRWTPVFAASWKTPTARAAARARRCPARPPSRAAAAWTCGSRTTTTASSTS